MLAGLVKSPSRLAPTRNFDGAEHARANRARRHDGRGLHRDPPRKVALAHPAALVAAGRRRLDQLCRRLGHGRVNDVIGRVDEDIVVETTIDPALQAGAEQAP